MALSTTMGIIAHEGEGHNGGNVLPRAAGLSWRAGEPTCRIQVETCGHEPKNVSLDPREAVMESETYNPMILD